MTFTSGCDCRISIPAVLPPSTFHFPSMEVTTLKLEASLIPSRKPPTRSVEW
jgi:hypothetical protein